jgi:hypothetical protein
VPPNGGCRGAPSAATPRPPSTRELARVARA